MIVKHKGIRLGRALGWFSIALGSAQVLLTERMNRLVGVDGMPTAKALMRGVGVQELTVGAAILNSPRPVGWLWSRVAGDVMHLAMLRAAMGSSGSDRSRVRAAAYAVLGVGVADLVAARALARASSRITEDGATRLRTAITVNRPPEEVYRSWRDFERLPQFMYHLESVQPTEQGRWHWVARAPAGKTVEWDAEIVEDRPGEVVAWRSLEGGDVDTCGLVRFAPATGDRGTEVVVEMEYTPPGGRAGAVAAKLFGESPEQQVRDDLRRFKQVMETGEVVRSDGSPEGSTTHRQLKQRPAQPVG
ncbi:MAG TPA: SRPBCC family protein [Egibacteraceae bacterium]|nr:SRPBCC family protein [Egibacteraceae bacterium]